MKVKRITIPLTQSLIKKIDKRGGSRPEIIERDLNFLYSLEFFGLYEIKGIFTDEELDFLAMECVQGLDLPPYVEPKTFLVANIQTVPDIRRLYKYEHMLSSDQEKLRFRKELPEWEKNRKSLIKSLIGKVQKLTSFQCYCIYRLIDLAFAQSENGVLPHNELTSIFRRDNPNEKK